MAREPGERTEQQPVTFELDVTQYLLVAAVDTLTLLPCCRKAGAQAAARLPSDMLFPVITLLLLLCSFVMSAPAVAQNIPVIHANVRQVLVPVVVSDSKGRRIRDLKRTDFKVVEEGVEEEIVAFHPMTSSVSPKEVGSTTPVAGNASSTQRPTSDPVRTYLLCIDTLHSSVSSLSRMKEAVAKVLRQEQGTDSQYALIALGRELRAIHDSTRDAAVIAAAEPGVSKCLPGQ